MKEYRGNIMTLAEVSSYLKLSEKTLLKMVKNQEIPCAKVANQWRFLKAMIDDWLISRMNVIPQNDLSRMIALEYERVPVSRLMDEKLIVHDLPAGTKETVLLRLVGLAADAGLVSDGPELLERLLEREIMASTAVGGGIALPHPRKPSKLVVSGPKIVAGVSEPGIDFDALDNRPTHLIFLLLTDSEIVHLRVMAKLSSLLRDRKVVNDLIKTKSAAEFMSIIIRTETINRNEYGGGT